ncbi:heterokaryon incompatibility protein [Seiridium cupressi]
MGWHDASCRRLDLVRFDGWKACLSCGSSMLESAASLPPIKHKSEIRLLQIHPGHDGAVINCQISTRNLSALPEFNAISYTWADESGDDSRCKFIYLDNKPYKVTRNCEAALRRARRKTANVRIWIDAVCIDQDNDQERGHQVELMPQIYSLAQTVYVYIGEHGNDSKRLIRSLEIALHHGKIIPESGLIHDSHAWGNIVLRRYFTRVWVLQEVVLARRAVLICGCNAIPWGHFIGHYIQSTKVEQGPSILTLRRNVYSDPDQELLLLDHGRKCHARDPRDKVYALLGLLPNRRIGGIGSDYTLSVEQLYIQLALHLASTYGWGQVLARAGFRYRSLIALPSWVPDWSFTGNISAARENNSSSDDNWHPESIHKGNAQSVEVNLIKIRHTIGQWLVLDSLYRAPQRYLCFPMKSQLFELMSADAKSSLLTRSWRLHLVSPTQPTSLFDPALVLHDSKPENLVYLPIEKAATAFPLSVTEIRACILDPGSGLVDSQDQSSEAALPPLPVTFSLLPLSLRSFLSFARIGGLRSYAEPPSHGEWVPEFELWNSCFNENYRQAKEAVQEEQSRAQLFAAHDAFWRLMVRSCAVRSQRVRIA